MNVINKSTRGRCRETDRSIDREIEKREIDDEKNIRNSMSVICRINDTLISLVGDPFY